MVRFVKTTCELWFREPIPEKNTFSFGYLGGGGAQIDFGTFWLPKLCVTMGTHLPKLTLTLFIFEAKTIVKSWSNCVQGNNASTSLYYIPLFSGC